VIDPELFAEIFRQQEIWERTLNMDPNTTLKEMLELAARVIRMIDHNDATLMNDFEMNASSLAERVQALDQWMTNGGFLPEKWSQIARVRNEA
jgi:hypothetical protein